MRSIIIYLSFILAFNCVHQPQVVTSQTTTPKQESPTTIALATTPEDAEPITSTLDSLAVNLDEASTSVVSAVADLDDPTDDESADKLPGIQGKSISSSDEGENAHKLDAKEDAETLAPAVAQQPGESLAAITQLANQHLNMSQVDQLYTTGFKDEQEVVESWHRMGKKLKRGISSIIGSIVPYALNMTQEAKISGNCTGAMLKWVLSMNQLKSWALKMLDASGKPIAGMLEGSLTMFGNYRQCLKIRAPDEDEIEFSGKFHEYFRGKYCIVQAKPWLPEKSRFYSFNTKLKGLMENEEDDSPWYDRTIFNELSEWALAFNFVNIRMDLCIPSMCTREDIQRVINFVLKDIDIKARVLRCETDPSDGGLRAAVFESSSPGETLTLALTDPADGVQQGGRFSKWFSQLGWLLVPALAVGLVLLATLISVAIKDEQKEVSRLKHTIKSFSLKHSLGSHLNVDYDQLADDKPLALYGIRFMLIIWVILVESAVNLKFEYLRELLMLKDFIFWWPLQIIINSTLQFDSIILLTAFTMGYKNSLNYGLNNARAVIRFVLDKYVRLMPSIMVMVALVILLPLAYRGPVWNDYVTKQSAVCESTGWLNTVFLQNYLPYGQICLPQTWLFCVELQLIVLMAPLVYYLNKSYIQNLAESRGNSINDLSALSSSTKASKIAQLSGMTNHDSNRASATKPLYWLRTLPGTILLGCIAFGLGSSFYNVYYNQLPPTWFYTMADPDSKAIYFSGHFMRLWTHVAVFAMGILAGIECRRAARNLLHSRRCRNIQLATLDAFRTHHKNGKSGDNSTNISSVSIDINTRASLDSNENINGSEQRLSGETDGTRSSCCASLCSFLLTTIAYIVAITIMALIIFTPHEWSINDLPQPLISGLFDAGSRFVWSMSLIWILYMVSVPNKDTKFSSISRLFGHPAMVCLGKLSFLIYLIHPFVHTTVLAIQEQPIYSSWLMLFHILIGNITITVILASLVSIFVEMPCRNLFRRCETSLLLTHNSGTTSSS